MNIDEFILAFQANHERVTNYLGSSTEMDLTVALATKYTLANRQYSGIAFQKVVDQLQKQLNEQKGYRSTIDFSSASTKLYKVAAHIQVSQLDHASVKRTIENDKRLHQVGFKSGLPRVIAALILSENVSHETNAKYLYDEIQISQQILTVQIDIPYAVLLTKNRSQKISDQAGIINRYHEELVKKKLKKGNNLYALSNTICLYDDVFNQQLVERVKSMIEAFEKREITIKKIHYPYLGVLIAISEQTAVVNTITAVYKKLLQTSALKYHKNLALVVAIQFAAKQLIETDEVLVIKETNQLLEILEISELTFLTSIGMLENVTGIVSDFIN